jgi:hypothetical protein
MSERTLVAILRDITSQLNEEIENIETDLPDSQREMIKTPFLDSETAIYPILSRLYNLAGRIEAMADNIEGAKGG